MITKDDVKVLRSERLTDEDDGGGRATGTAVVDNQMNNLFADISRLDRTTGRIALRKVFAGIVTASNDAYLGAHAILTAAALDPRVSALLFNTGSQTDTRLQARSLIESYMAPSATANWKLLGNQLAGQRAIVAIQREEQRLPEVGEVYQLVSGSSSQFVRITSIDSTIETFTIAYGAEGWFDFQRRRLVMSISAPLNFTFPGGEATPTGTSATSPTTGQAVAQVLSTTVADAARYYGISPVAQAVALGSLSLKVESIYSQLVPSTSKENALLSLIAGFENTMIVEASGTRTSSPVFVTVTGGQSKGFLGTGCALGSLVLTANGGTYKDDSSGNLQFVSGSNWLQSGTVDYATGELNLSRTGTAWTGTASASYKVGARMLGETITDGESIQLGNRGFVYSLNLSSALPRPGTLVVSFMTMGKWYELRDNGRGELAGEGAGSVDYASGAVSITLNALPDVGSALMYSYISQADSSLVKHTGPVAASSIRIFHQLPVEGIKPSSVTVGWKVAGVDKSATDDGLGAFTGDATGIIVYATGEIELVMTTTPDTASAFVFNFEQGANLQEVKSTAADGAGMATFTIAGAPLKPGSVELEFMTTRRSNIPTLVKDRMDLSQTYSTTQTVNHKVRDNGSGGWVGRTGTINYTTGVCWVQVAVDYSYEEYTYYREGFGIALAPGGYY